MDLIESVGEISSSTSDFCNFRAFDIKNEVFNKLIEIGNDEALSDPEFREHLDNHFNQFPVSYAVDINMDKVEDVLLHKKLLALSKRPNNFLVYHIRFLEEILCARSDGDTKQQFKMDFSSGTMSCNQTNEEGAAPLHQWDSVVKSGQSSRPEDTNLDGGHNFNAVEGNTGDVLIKKDTLRIHEVIFCSLDKPKLLCQLSAMLSDIGLNIREAHVFSTLDGYSLGVYVVDGWSVEDTTEFYEELEKAIWRSEGSWKGSMRLHLRTNETLASIRQSADWEIDENLFRIGEIMASGSCGDLHIGVYGDMNVAVKVLRTQHLNETTMGEFAQEVAILREVRHKNVVRFIGACTKAPNLCIVTEYMPCGSLYDYLHKSKNVLSLHRVLKYAIDVCKGMEYLHQNNIIHRDLKTANLLLDMDDVVKVADFGVARFQGQGGVMTAETGTYRWMAPEVINHQQYDEKADIFSFGIVLWELTSSKIPYDNMTPLQAALGVRQGIRPEPLENTNPGIMKLMKRCWDANPKNRPSFSEIILELQNILQQDLGMDS